jgi:CDP-glycerol glycerophosphotransferase (TagB/SpsB family)
MILEEKFVRHIKKILQKIIKNNPWYKLPYAIPIGLLRDVIYYVCTYFFNIFIKENKNKKPIIGFSNLYYTGNPRAVFEYMLKNEHNYEIYWLAPNSKSIKDVEKAGGKAFNYKDLFGIPYFLKTDIWVVAHKGYDIPFLPHKNYKIIQLWHGVGEKHVQHSQKEFEKYDVWCSPSEYIKQKHVELWKVTKEKFYVTGYARMDMLYKNLKKPKQ